MRVNFVINAFTIIQNKINIEILQKENKIYKKTAKMFGFSEFLVHFM